MPSTMILENDSLSLGIVPERGGIVSFFRVEGKDIFYPSRIGEELSAQNAASFPLVPFSNRIRHGKFSFKGKAYKLAVNWNGDDNAIHGNGWNESWQVSHSDASKCELTLINDSKWWPWSFKAALQYELKERSLVMSMLVRNTSDDDMPLGVGFHPYFVATEKTSLQFQSDSAYLPFQQENAVDLKLQAQHVLDFNKLGPVKVSSMIDHNYDGWNGEAIVKNCNDDIDLVIRSDEGMRRAMVYSPVGEGYFCFEPTSHSAGAFNSEEFEALGGQILAPGESFTTNCSFEVLKA